MLIWTQSSNMAQLTPNRKNSSQTRRSLRSTSNARKARSAEKIIEGYLRLRVQAASVPISNSTTPYFIVWIATHVSISIAIVPSKMDFARLASSRSRLSREEGTFSANCVVYVGCWLFLWKESKESQCTSFVCWSMVFGNSKTEPYSSNLTPISTLITPLTPAAYATPQFTPTPVGTARPRHTLCAHT